MGQNFERNLNCALGKCSILQTSFRIMIYEYISLIAICNNEIKVFLLKTLFSLGHVSQYLNESQHPIISIKIMVKLRKPIKIEQNHVFVIVSMLPFLNIRQTNTWFEFFFVGFIQHTCSFHPLANIWNVGSGW